MANVFASYATEKFFAHRDALCQSALNVGFDRAIKMSPNDFIGTDFEKRNAHILALPRGAGYWLWKPWLIKEELKKLRPGDVLVYCDAGRSSYYSMSFFPEKLIEILKKNEKGFLLGPAIFQHGSLKMWTKRDCLRIMEMDESEILNRPIIQATWSFWMPHENTFKFIDLWLKYCEDYRCLTDAENVMGFDNYPEFKDHRHDQSVLTLLAYKMDAPFLDFSKTMIFDILKLRRKSGLANFFLKRIDDAELLAKNKITGSLIKSFLDIRAAKKSTISY